MSLDIFEGDIALLNQFHLLQPEGRQDVQEYLRYTLFKQYRRELYTTILGYQPLYNGLLQIAHMCEREDTGTEEIFHRAKQVKFLFYQRYEKVRAKYASVLIDLHIEDSLRDFARMEFESIFEAIHTNRKDLIKREIEEFLEIFTKLSFRQARRRIVAV